MGFSKLDYCQYLLSSPVNYTLTNLAEHLQNVSHDTINRYLRNQALSPRLLWESVKGKIVQTAEGYLLFDDTVLDKGFGPSIEMARRQWSGNAHAIVRGIGLISCIYLNATTGQFWIIDYRLFDPDRDGKSKIDHVLDMLEAVERRQIAYRTVLMDSWYAAGEIFKAIDEREKIYYCPLKSNRLVNDSDGIGPNVRVSQLSWTGQELQQGKTVHLRGFPKEKLLKLFQITVSTHRTDWVVTNDLSQSSRHDTQEASRLRWKIEEFHREIKQLTGIEQCQCRKRRIQRNHIACALLVWVRLKTLAYERNQTVYRLKRGLLSDYLIQQLKTPAIRMTFA